MRDAVLDKEPDLQSRCLEVDALATATAKRRDKCEEEGVCIYRPKNDFLSVIAAMKSLLEEVNRAIGAGTREVPLQAGDPLRTDIFAIIDLSTTNNTDGKRIFRSMITLFRIVLNFPVCHRSSGSGDSR